MAVTCLPVARSQIRTVRSWLPEATVLPSGLNATASTGPWWLVRVASSLPVLTSQRQTVLSLIPAEASTLPSGLNRTHRTEAVCPLRTASSLSVPCVPEPDDAPGVRRGEDLAVGAVRHGED